MARAARAAKRAGGAGEVSGEVAHLQDMVGTLVRSCLGTSGAMEANGQACAPFGSGAGPGGRATAARINALLTHKRASSHAALAEHLGLDPRQIQPIAEVAAHMAVQVRTELLRRIVLSLGREQAKGRLTCSLFIHDRAYDETPEAFRTTQQTPSGPNTDPVVAKVLAARARFAMVIEAPLAPERWPVAGAAAMVEQIAASARQVWGARWWEQGVDAVAEELAEEFDGYIMTDGDLSLYISSIEAAIAAAIGGCSGDACAGAFPGLPRVCPAAPAQTSVVASCWPGHFIIMGVLPTTLAPMQQQTVDVLLETATRIAWVPADLEALLESTCQRLVRNTTCDLHPSNLKAERSEASRRLWWASSRVRCGLHRADTAQKSTVQLDKGVESGLLNLTLSFRAPGLWAKFRREVAAWLALHLRVLTGHPPPDAIAWRARVEATFLQVDFRQRRWRNQLFVWRELLNGDIRRTDEAQHYCNGCHANAEEAHSDVCRQVVHRLLRRVPGVYPRKSWLGADDCVDAIGFLVSLHGLLPAAWATVARAAAVVAPSAAGPVVGDQRSERGAAADPRQEDEGDVAGEGAADIGEERAFWAVNAATAQSANMFLQDSDVLPRLTVMRIHLRAFCQMKAAMFARRRLGYYPPVARHDASTTQA